MSKSKGSVCSPFKKTQQVFPSLFSDIECVLTISWPLIFNVEFGSMHRIAEEQTTFGRSSVLPKGQYIWEAASIFRTKKKCTKGKKRSKVLDITLAEKKCWNIILSVLLIRNLPNFHWRQKVKIWGFHWSSCSC